MTLQFIQLQEMIYLIAQINLHKIHGEFVTQGKTKIEALNTLFQIINDKNIEIKKTINYIPSPYI